MRSLSKMSLVVAALMASTAMVQAADMIPPPPEDDYVPEVLPHSSVGGWYIRGDIGYAHMSEEGVRYFQGPFFTGYFEQHDLEAAWFIQGGVGYQVNDWFRVDATLRYHGSSDFTGSSAPAGSPCAGFASTCSYSDNAELEASTILLANAYVDLGTINGFTAYAGAGIGGAHVKWGDLINDQTCDPGAPAGCDDEDFIHPGQDQWRFAWALHAGATYDVTCRTKVDAGYTYTRIEGGRMFGSGYGAPGSTAPGVAAGGYGYDDGLEFHSAQVGLRYSLDDSGCTPPPPPIVYK